MLYAKVVFSLAIEGPFDYIVPQHLYNKIREGSRVWVSLRTQKTLGYVVKLTNKTKIKYLKEISDVIDDSAVLDQNMLTLTREIADYYCCSWGQAIDTALPEAVRKGMVLPNNEPSLNNGLRGLETNTPTDKDTPESILNSPAGETILVHDCDLDIEKRWQIYTREIKKSLNDNKSVIVLLPDIDSVLKYSRMLTGKLTSQVKILYRKQPKELDEWLAVKLSKLCVVMGTRSAIFAPLSDLGLIIIDEEENPVYKQDQVPHYHARQAAFLRADIQNSRLILGSAAPSVESFYQAKESKIKYLPITRTKSYPQIDIINTKELSLEVRSKGLVSLKYLADAVNTTLNSAGKTLLFLNRKGFATFASCRNCGTVLKCPRCNINLVYHFKEQILSCHYCNFKMPPPDICTNCNSGYIRYSGTGTEKIESELYRLFPQAKIKQLDRQTETGIDEADIFISTQYVIKLPDFNFDLMEVLSIDNSLNHLDFRSGEKTFKLLFNLTGLTQKRIIIETQLSKHHVFKALTGNNSNIFYEEELKQRKSLGFPPYSHLCLIKLRGKKESRVEQISQELFKLLTGHNKNKRVEIISVNPAIPPKLRGNFYWQILVKAGDARFITKFLKKYLQDFSHSGIIVTVDVDPV
ncbi:MAG: primosomal protein N' [Candidatus Omnitrophota bacterium]